MGCLCCFVFCVCFGVCFLCGLKASCAFGVYFCIGWCFVFFLFVCVFVLCERGLGLLERVVCVVWCAVFSGMCFFCDV